ncbi:MAG: response regulator [Elusimicrobia bacterium]|nr:response regulator [Elusimicrobiota bacterium]
MANILVVDDEKDVVTLIKFLLEKDGHRVAEAFNGAEALKLLGVEPPDPSAALPDLIILDVMMPVVDGYTTATKLRENAETRAIPLVILTAKGQMRDVFEMTPNVAAYIEKPFDPKQLRDLVTGMFPSGGPSRP